MMRACWPISEASARKPVTDEKWQPPPTKAHINSPSATPHFFPSSIHFHTSRNIPVRPLRSASVSRPHPTHGCRGAWSLIFRLLRSRSQGANCFRHGAHTAHTSSSQTRPPIGTIDYLLGWRYTLEGCHNSAARDLHGGELACRVGSGVESCSGYMKTPVGCCHYV
jgi:hypothetical protein